MTFRTSTVRNTFTTISLSAAAMTTLAFSLVLTGCKAKTVDDATLASNVHTALTSDAAISSEPIQAGVVNGVTTLTGNVSSDTARLVAAQDAAKVAGVKEVVNNLSVSGVALAPTITSPAAPTQARPATPQEAQTIDSGGSLAPPDSSNESAPPAPVVQELTIPAGANLHVRVDQTISSANAQPGQQFTGVVTQSVIVNGQVAIPAGSSVSGHVTGAHDAGHYSGNSRLSVIVDEINRHGSRVHVTSDEYALEGKGRGKNTAEKIGGGAAIGAVLGGIFGHGKGALIGAAAGGGGGAVINGVTRGQEVAIESESVIYFHLASSVTVSSEGPAGVERPEGLQQR